MTVPGEAVLLLRSSDSCPCRSGDSGSPLESQRVGRGLSLGSRSGSPRWADRLREPTRAGEASQDPWVRTARAQGSKVPSSHCGGRIRQVTRNCLCPCSWTWNVQPSPETQTLAEPPERARLGLLPLFGSQSSIGWGHAALAPQSPELWLDRVGGQRGDPSCVRSKGRSPKNTPNTLQGDVGLASILWLVHLFF